MDSKLPCSETVLTTDGPKNGCYVIVYNKSNFGPTIRHIITNTMDWTLNDFVEWYYTEYTKLDGDEFVVCETRDERDRITKMIQSDGW